MCTFCRASNRVSVAGPPLNFHNQPPSTPTLIFCNHRKLAPTSSATAKRPVETKLPTRRFSSLRRQEHFGHGQTRKCRRLVQVSCAGVPGCSQTPNPSAQPGEIAVGGRNIDPTELLGRHRHQARSASRCGGGWPTLRRRDSPPSWLSEIAPRLAQAAADHPENYYS